jgi:hypothetical protein
MLSALLPLRVQAAPMRISSPGDAAEREAEATAKKIMQMPPPAAPVTGSRTGLAVQRSVGRIAYAKLSPSPLARAPLVQRKGEGQASVAPDVQQEIQGSMNAGAPLPPNVRGFMEPRFRANFSDVRIHTGQRAPQLARRLNARAFTVGRNIFFGRDQFRPESREGGELIAHELTHTIQQQAVVQRSEEASVSERAPVQVQRFGISDALDYFADKANIIPGFRMFTIILGVNPINMTRVERSAANILRALIEFIPGGGLITQALDNYGIFEKVGGWIEQQIKTLGMTGAAIKQAVSAFLDSLGWRDIFDLGGVWARAKRIFTEPIDRIINFAKGVVGGIITFIKDAILQPIARLAEGTRGYDLLKAILGRDPVTGEAFPRTAETLIGGFMKLIGQEEVWNNIKKANALARCWAWFQGAMGTLLGFVQDIPSVFLNAFRSLELTDIILVPRAFAKIAGVFGSFIGKFISWAGNAVWNLLQIIFEVVAPGAMPYIKKAAAAFRTILKDPIGFVGNLVRAGKLGFQQFAGKFGAYLKDSLIAWLTGSLGGTVYIPQSFSLREIIKFVLSVLGLTWQNIRTKLVRAIGETAVKVLEAGFDIVVTLVTEGPAAAWEKIKEQLSNLREMVMEEIMNFVVVKVVQSAVVKLVSMLNPAGAVIQAIIAIYNTVMFFIERLQQIIQVAMAFIDSISAIAGGVIAAAANRVEKTLAGLLTLAISFLARIAGLGKVSDAVIGIINKIRAPIDRALDKVVEWIVATARRLGRLAASGVAAAVNWLAEYARPRPFQAGRERHTAWITPDGRVMVASTPSPARAAVATLRNRFNQMPAPSRPADAAAKIAAADSAIGAVETQTAQAGSATGRAAPPGLRAAWDAFIVKLTEAYAVFTTQGDMPLFPPMTFGFNSSKYTGAARSSYEAECRRQLHDQEAGINALKAGQWAANRARYTAVRRSASDTENIAEYRTLLRSEVIRIRLQILEEQGIPDPPRRQQAEAFANDLMSRNAVLHIPDQVAGGTLLVPRGKPTAVGQYEVQVGIRGVNSAIGSGWGNKAAELALLEQQAAQADPLARMNVRLNESFT